MKTALIALSLSCLMLTTTFARQTVAGVDMPAPWPTGSAFDTHWGTRVPDPYRELENIKDERVQAWLRAQAQATEKVMAQLPGRDTLLARIQALQADANGVATSLTRSDDGRLFFLRRNPGEQQLRLILRESLDAEPVRDRVLIDPDALSKAAGKPIAIMDFAPSPDGRLLAYSLQSGGGEIGSLQVVEVATGKVVVAAIDRIRYASANWLPDSTGFFYQRLREGYEAMPATERFGDRTTHLHMLGGSDRAVFSASMLSDFKLPPIATGHLFALPGTPRVAAWVSLGVERSAMLLVTELDALKAGRATWRRLVDTGDMVSQFTLGGPGDEAIYLRSAKAAPRFQVLKLRSDATSLGQAELVVPQSDAVITRIAGARDGLYLTRRDGVNSSLWRLPTRGAKLEAVPLPQTGSVGIRQASRQADGVLANVASWTRASVDYHWQPAVQTAAQRATPVQLAMAGKFDAPAGIESREVMVKSHDGVMVPASIIARSALKLDGSHPTIVYGYGAYGLVESPGFGATLLAWLEQGGVYVYAHVRGGGVYGDDWHKAGYKTTKPNTWKDGIAVAEWLIANGYTSAQKLGIYGGSAGGIFVGRAMTERPDLFAAAVPAVPVLDTVRSELRANGVANVPEYGTVAKEDEFRGLLAMSSYHALKDGTRYPAVMLTHGVNDIRVDVWQSAKFAARLAAAQGADKPVLMRLEYDGGHGAGSSRLQAQERQADVWAFFLWQFGVPGFAPRAVQ